MNEIVLVLRKLCAEHNLMLFDDFGLMLMPDGSTYPEEVAYELDNYADILKKRQAGGYSNELPNKRKDFYNLFKAKFDPVMQRYGFVFIKDNATSNKHNHILYELSREYGCLQIAVYINGSGSRYKTEISYDFIINKIHDITTKFLVEPYGSRCIHSETLYQSEHIHLNTIYDMESLIQRFVSTDLQKLVAINSIAAVEQRLLTDYKWQAEDYIARDRNHAYHYLALIKLANNPHYERYKVQFHASVVQEIISIIEVDENDHAFNERYRNTLEEFEANWPKFIELLEK